MMNRMMTVILQMKTMIEFVPSCYLNDVVSGVSTNFTLTFFRRMIFDISKFSSIALI